MNYQNILQFKGTWRNYQARVLEKAEKYMKDGRIHIVAAPGSGKTTLGIELIARMNEVAIVLTPSITIREQWVARIAEGFLCEGLEPADYISQDLKKEDHYLQEAQRVISIWQTSCVYIYLLHLVH